MFPDNYLFKNYKGHVFTYHSIHYVELTKMSVIDGVTADGQHGVHNEPILLPAATSC